MARNPRREKSIPEHELEISINEELRQELVKYETANKLFNKIEKDIQNG